MSELSELYSKDYTAWAQRMAELLKAGELSQLDIEHLVEELEGRGASEQKELLNRLRVLLAHLLKWQFQYRQLSDRWQEFDGRSWRATIKNQRYELWLLLEDNPGLKRFLSDALTRGYQQARGMAANETELPLDTFPIQCPYTQAQILDKAFYPPTK